MESTTCLHQGITNPVFQEASLVFDETGAFHPAHGGFDADADGRDGPMGCFRCGREFPSRGLLLGLDEGDPRARIALEAQVLRETTVGWDGRARTFREACIMPLPCRGGPQEANLAGLLEHKEVLARGAFLLATVGFLLGLGSGWAVERPLRTSRPTRGRELPSVAWGLNLAAHAAAVRAGSRAWSAQACFHPAWRRCSH
jgi:hypothetical protein